MHENTNNPLFSLTIKKYFLRPTTPNKPKNKNAVPSKNAHNISPLEKTHKQNQRQRHKQRKDSCLTKYEININNNAKQNKISGLKGQGSVEPHSLILPKTKITLSGTSIKSTKTSGENSSTAQSVFKGLMQKQNELKQRHLKNNKTNKQNNNKNTKTKRKPSTVIILKL
jgi:hypothetical protein